MAFGKIWKEYGKNCFGFIFWLGQSNFTEDFLFKNACNTLSGAPFSGHILSRDEVCFHIVPQR